MYAWLEAVSFSAGAVHLQTTGRPALCFRLFPRGDGDAEL